MSGVGRIGWRGEQFKCLIRPVQQLPSPFTYPPAPLTYFNRSATKRPVPARRSIVGIVVSSVASSISRVRAMLADVGSSFLRYNVIMFHSLLETSWGRSGKWFRKI